ncbi:uncharacterized protein PAC_04334 [Phialocephala subalpina]|uniref:Uncharacterized protein n=1 Tax=Phialocephala subalpina TaxID=576137 RepID=A0A1L7WNV3_9HELO|nr:uncharacterized protein PAC_04334 [Phialocephala subalpina]
MDRNEGIIRWSPNTSRDEFMVFNLNNRVAHLHEAIAHAQPGRFDYKKASKHTEIPAINTYDWSPAIRGLVAVGTVQGHVHLLRVDDNSNAALTLPLKLQRPCQSVAFNTTGLLAVGLDRVRNDSCLQVWDINERLAKWDPTQSGWTVPNMSVEPKRKLEGSTSITSIRFFEDQPQTLVCGVKNQSVRVHDLRDPNSSVINFQTRCNNNIAIDYMDSNYFASSSLDQPGLVVWDRRVSSRSGASPMYLESFDQDEIPWGAVLKLDRAIDIEKDVFIKQLRYSREQRGVLGVLSTAGQLQILRTKKEFIEPGSPDEVPGSPELLEVRKSYDLEYPYFDPAHKRKHEHRIVSFDWLNLGTTDLSPRVVALRATGEFEILQMPATTANQLSQMIPWKPPHRCDPYLTLLNISDLKEREKMLGPLYATAAKADVPVFGAVGYKSLATKEALNTAIINALESRNDPVVDLLAPRDSANQPLEDSVPTVEAMEDSFSQLRIDKGVDKKAAQTQESAPDSKASKVHTSRELHDKSHYKTIGCIPADKATHDNLDHVMLQRAVDGYLFDCRTNKAVVDNDPWLQDVWEWILDAVDAARDDGMISTPLDLSYMGVYTIWQNLLGEKPNSRLLDVTVIPDSSQWEHLISAINKQANRPEFSGIKTTKPQHRQLCLAVCGQLKSSEDFEDNLKHLQLDGLYTKAAAWALFEGLSDRAVEILKNGGTDLLFAAMALDIKLKSNASLDLDNIGWKKALESHPQMAEDPYLRAIYRYMTTGSWEAVADEKSLPLRDRVWVALRNFEDDKLTYWLSREMEECVRTGDIEGIVLGGITDPMVDVLSKYIEKFMDYQTPILIMSFCYPRYIDDLRCEAWRKAYKDFLQRHKQFILRVKFEQQSTKKSRVQDGTPVIKPPPRQVTIRCLNCDANAANDLQNSGGGPASTSIPSSSATVDLRNPLAASGINAGLCCPKCGAHLPRCAVCMEIVGVPRSDRPEQSTDPNIRRMANFPTFCLKCKHVQHMDHSIAWFKRHNECPVPECKCQCNERGSRIRD